jgi:hypothetical protein
MEDRHDLLCKACTDRGFVESAEEKCAVCTNKYGPRIFIRENPSSSHRICYI